MASCRPSTEAVAIIVLATLVVKLAYVKSPIVLGGSRLTTADKPSENA